MDSVTCHWYVTCQPMLSDYLGLNYMAPNMTPSNMATNEASSTGPSTVPVMVSYAASSMATRNQKYGVQEITSADVATTI